MIMNECRRIAKFSGHNCTAAKESVVCRLIQMATNEEAKFIVRFLLKTLKTGAGEKTMLSALARAIVYTPPNKPIMMNSKRVDGPFQFARKCEIVEGAIN